MDARVQVQEDMRKRARLAGKILASRIRLHDAITLGSRREAVRQALILKELEIEYRKLSTPAV